jgi:hypothetical protein
VLALILLVVIIAIAVSCSGGSTHKPPSAGGEPDPHQSSSTQPTQIAACNASSLTLSVSTDTVTYTSGQAPKLIGEFTNPTSATCRLPRAVSAEIWTIKSGTPTIWTTQGCPGSAVPAHAKIPAGGTKLVSIFWDGHVRGSDCKDGAVAQAGTYRLYATLDGVQQTKPAIFHITS